MKQRTYIMEVLVAIDRTINAVFAGSCDETISGRAHRRRMAGKGAWADFIDMLAFDLFSRPDHCHRAWLYESTRWAPQTTQDEAGAALVIGMKEPA